MEQTILKMNLELRGKSRLNIDFDCPLHTCGCCHFGAYLLPIVRVTRAWRMPKMTFQGTETLQKSIWRNRAKHRLMGTRAGYTQESIMLWNVLLPELMQQPHQLLCLNIGVFKFTSKYECYNEYFFQNRSFSFVIYIEWFPCFPVNV